MSEAHETTAGVTRRELVRAAASGSGTTAVGPAFGAATNAGRAETVTAEATVGSEATSDDTDSSFERRSAMTAGVGTLSAVVGIVAVLYAFGRWLGGR
ncbi:hypothetical protein [Haloprofundus salinisoli]|uniref:hypothetical protein n=1 Tax=Haloprofundus salinisoli TaxID=2876193 RepID=UPI001CCCBA1D|nr:hypothetical protein [Haloprofundus salinisoli]